MRDVRRDEMLAAVGLSPERYERYVELLDVIGARRARFIEAPGRPAVVSLFLDGAGWAASSYYVNVIRPSDPPAETVDDIFAYMEREGYGTYKAYAPLGDGWYAELDMVW